MKAEHGLELSHQVVSYHRGKLAPELQAGDLEAVQVGAASFPEQVKALAEEIQVLHTAAITGGKLSSDKGAAFSLMVAGQLRRELRELQGGAYDRLLKREQMEGKLEIDRGRLKIEREKWAQEKAMIERENRLAEAEDAAAEVDAQEEI